MTTSRVGETRSVRASPRSAATRNRSRTARRASSSSATGLQSVANVLERIDELFADRASHDVIVFSSTHKAKGLERERVWMLVGTYRRRPGQEEENLYYVAATRARRTLHLVEGFEKKRRSRDEEGDGLPKAVDDYMREALS